MNKEKVLLGLIALVAIIFMLLYFFQPFEKENQEKEKIEVNEEQKASEKLEEELEELRNSKLDESKKPVKKKSQNDKKTYNDLKERGVKFSDPVFNYNGKPDLSHIKYDFGILLTPVTTQGDVYVPIKYITKKYMAKISQHIPGLSKNGIPMTDKPNPKNRPQGKKWKLDKSGKVFFFVDFGQKVQKTNNENIARIPLNAYAGEKPGGHEIWLMYEAAVLNKEGVSQMYNNGTFASNGAGGYDYVAFFKGFKK